MDSAKGILKWLKIGALAVLLCAESSTLRGAERESSIDSLYVESMKSQVFDYEKANRLMLMLDVEGATDSLVSFDRHTKQCTMMKTIHFSMATYYYERATNMTAAQRAAQRAEVAAREDCDTAMISEALSMQSVTAIRMGQMETALRAAQEELRLDEQTGNVSNQSRAYNILAAVSLQTNRLDDAEQYVLKAIDMERSLPDSSLLSVRYGMATEIYTKKGDYEKAYEYGQRAYELDRMSGDEVKAARRLSQMADIFVAQGRLSEAETFCERAIATLRGAGEEKSLAITLKQLGQIYLKQHQHNKAHQTLTECEKLCRATGHDYVLQQVCRMQAEAVENLSPKQAVAYLQEALRLSDSLHSERAEQLADEIRRSQNDALAERQMPTQKKSRLLSDGILILANVLIIVGFWFYFRKKKMPEQASLAVLNRELPNIPAKHVDKELDFLVRVTELYERNLEKQRLSIDELASEMCMSRSQFTRRIVAATGNVPSVYFNRLRMEKAARLLKESERPISAIAYECGFDDTPYFCNLFKKFFKMTPMQYRIMPKREQSE